MKGFSSEKGDTESDRDVVNSQTNCSLVKGPCKMAGGTQRRSSFALVRNVIKSVQMSLIYIIPMATNDRKMVFHGWRFTMMCQAHPQCVPTSRSTIPGPNEYLVCQGMSQTCQKQMPLRHAIVAKQSAGLIVASSRAATLRCLIDLQCFNSAVF